MNAVPGPESTGSQPPSKKFLEAFQAIFPGLLRDGVLDAQRLGELLDVEVAGVKAGKERFGLMWAGKQRAVEALQTPSYAALVPDFENSIDWESAENAFIEGDNLEVLKLLQKSYNDQVKLIYIDPPYNTGGDFVYNDDFSDPLQHYLEITGQVDAEGNRLTANTETSGRRHSNWLTMMYPRLVLARNLLTQDGCIFVSIDDNEVHNLRQILDEVFGPENFIANFVWVNNLKGRQISGAGPAGTKEYILVYARNITQVEDFRASATELKKLMPSVYRGFDFEVKTDDRGPYVLKNELHNTNSAFNEATRPNLVYDIYYNPLSGEVKTESLSDKNLHPTFVKIGPKQNNNGTHKYHAFRWGRPKVEAEFYNLEFQEVRGTWKVFTKVRDVDSTSVKDLLMDITTNSGSDDLQKVGIDPKLFDYPKPVALIQIFVAIATSKDSIVLDFFAGSGTTAHAVASQNLIDGGRRKHLLVTLDEATPDGSHARRAGIEKVSEITLMRIRNVISQIGGAGLKVLRLGGSAFKPRGLTLEQQLISDSTRSDDREIRQVAAEVATWLGIALDVPWVESERDGMSVLKVGSTGFAISGSLNPELVNYIQDLGCEQLICLEDDFIGQDSHRANLFFKCKNANITFKTF